MMRYFYFLCAICLLSSCASTQNTAKNDRYVVEVDAYGNDSYLNSKRYILISGDSTVNEYNLQYIEFSDYIRKTLNTNGYIETTSADDAALMIYFRYGISDPKTFQETRSVPVWGQTGISSINTTSKTTSRTTTTTSLNVTPTYGITGYSHQTQTYTKYFRFLTLDAYDLNVLKSTKKMKMIWSTTLTSDGSSNDLRKVIPYMIVAGSPYFGKNSGEKKSLDIYGNDERVNQLKGI